MNSPIDNPFANPELLHPDLAADIAETEAWQAENLVTDVEVAAGGLAKALEETLLAAPEWVKPELVEVYEEIAAQAETSREATNQLIENLNGVPGRRETLKSVEEQDFTVNLRQKLKEWHDNGSLEWAREYIAQGGWAPCEMILVGVPTANINGPELAIAARRFAGDKVSRDMENGGFINLYSTANVTGRTDRLDDTPEQASGRLDLILIPTIAKRFSRSFERNEYMQTVRGKQANISKPSMLDALGYFYALKAEGTEFEGGHAYALTYIEDFPAQYSRETKHNAGRYGRCLPSMNFDVSGYLHIDPKDQYDDFRSLRLVIT